MIHAQLSIPSDHWLVEALGSTSAAREALRAIVGEVLNGLDEDGSTDQRPHVHALAETAKAVPTDAYNEVLSDLTIGNRDPQFIAAREAVVDAGKLETALRPMAVLKTKEGCDVEG